MHKVAIDAGHGGTDFGATGINGIKEKDLALAVALELNKILTDDGRFETILTRDGDYAVGHYEGQVARELYERAKIANDFGAELFISIHFNKFTGQARGSEVLVSKNSIGLSDTFAKELLDQLQVNENSLNRGVIQTGTTYAVIRETKMPAVITESAFIDNAADIMRFTTSQGKQNLARYHYIAICKTFGLDEKTFKTVEEKINLLPPKNEESTKTQEVQTQTPVQESVVSQTVGKPEPIPVTDKPLVNLSALSETATEKLSFNVPKPQSYEDAIAMLEVVISFMKESE